MMLYIGIYLLIGIFWHAYLVRLIKGKHADAFNQADKDQMDALISFVIVMVLWPKIAFPFMWGMTRDFLKYVFRRR